MPAIASMILDISAAARTFLLDSAGYRPEHESERTGGAWPTERAIGATSLNRYLHPRLQITPIFSLIK